MIKKTVWRSFKVSRQFEKSLPPNFTKFSKRTTIRSVHRGVDFAHPMRSWGNNFLFLCLSNSLYAKYKILDSRRTYLWRQGIFSTCIYCTRPKIMVWALFLAGLSLIHTCSRRNSAYFWLVFSVLSPICHIS